MENIHVPAPSLKFMTRTFEFIDTGEPHIVAAAFCFGREGVIPDMFMKIARQLQISNTQAPKFHYYLQRHIEVDRDAHGPAAIELVETLCDHDPVHIHEAEQAALEALEARIRLWSEVEQAIESDMALLRHN
jgi:pyrroloquinoline quinone (PQQ) biosynthesis protein C